MESRGRIDERILRDHLERGTRLRSRLADPPQLRAGLELYWEAYRDLDASRAPNGYIPASEVIVYADRMRFDDRQLRKLLACCKVLDRELADIRDERAER